MAKTETLRETLAQTIGSEAADAAIKTWKRSWEQAAAREAEEADDAAEFDAAAVGQTRLLQAILASRPDLATCGDGESPAAVNIVVAAEIEITR